MCVFVCVKRDPHSSDAAVGELAPPHTSQCPLTRYAACMLSLRTVSMETPEPGGT